MENNTETTERAYSTKEVAAMIDIAVPTVRKYAQQLEKGGYVFIKADGGARLFIERDIMAFRYLIDLRNKTDIKVEQAANVVVEKFGKGAIQSVAGSDTTAIRPYNGQYKEFISLIHQQAEYVKGLHDRLDQLQAENRELKGYIDQRFNEQTQEQVRKIDELQQYIKERDEQEKEQEKKRREEHDQKLIQRLRDSMEAQKQIAAAAAEAEEQKKSWWQRLFKK